MSSVQQRLMPSSTASAVGDSPLLTLISDYAAWYGEQTPDAPAATLDGQVQTYAELAHGVDALARAIGFRFDEDVALPANNRCISWHR